MTRGAKTLGYAIGGLFLGGGILLEIADGSGIGLLVIGALIVAGIALEPRYRRKADSDGAGRWKPTGERFIDEETGQLVEVWYDPADGRRDYRQAPPRADA